MLFFNLIFAFSLDEASSDESDTEEASKPVKGQHDFMVSDDVSREK